MEITLITKEQHDELISIKNENPVLSLQNEGYEYIPKAKIGDKEKSEIKKVVAILSEAITGFSSFTNFRVSRKGFDQIRFQYDWTADNEENERSFIGVGYIEIGELLNGFKTKES